MPWRTWEIYYALAHLIDGVIADKSFADEEDQVRGVEVSSSEKK